MAEAKGLGELLKDLQEKEDTSSLVKLAEEALGKYRPAEPRDNLMGSASESSGSSTNVELDHKRKERDTARGLVEDTLSPHVIEHSAGPHTQTSTSRPTSQPDRIVTSGMVGSVPDILADVLPEQAVDLAPIVVQESPSVGPGHEERDEWTETVKSGQRRLV